MKRRLFNAGALVSLMLCLAIAILWLRSYWFLDGCDRWTRAHLWSDGGSLSVIWATHDLARLSFNVDPLSEPGLARFEYASLSLPSGGELSAVRVPHWAVIFSLAPMPFLWVWNRFRKKTCVWVCPACGYDLRGTPGSECPECGAPRGPEAAKA